MLLKKISYSFLFLTALTFALLVACNKGGNDSKPDFDRKAMLQNFSENLIKPAFNDLAGKVNSLKAAAESFTAAPDAAKLAGLQQSWDETYSSWMYAAMYNFGPAGEEGTRKCLVNEISTWPVNTQAVEANISANNTSFNDFNRDNRGLLAVEYLIFGNGNAGNVVASFSNANRKNYLLALINKIKSQVDAVANEWNGSYAAAFVNNAGTDVGSSTSKLYNEFVESFESIKNFKVALPLGKRVGQTGPEPSRVEAFYSGKSLKYVRLHLQAIENIWYGKSKNGSDGIGWKEYLEFVTGGKDLVARTEAQMAAIKTVLNAIPDMPSMQEQISSNYGKLEAFYTELQKHLRNYKSDMSSLLGIAITYSSGDGD